MSKNILVTGATGNLGTIVTERLIKEGYTVSGTTRSSPQKFSNKMKYFQSDLTSHADTTILFNQLRETHKKLNAAVLLTGGFSMSGMLDSTDEDLHKMYRINFFTAFHVAQRAFEWMSGTGGGHLIFIGSKPAVEKGGAAMIPYSLAKASVVKLAELINEAGQKVNVRASVVVPSIIDTPENRSAMPNANFKDWVTPKEIAETICFLISDYGDPLREMVVKIYGNS